MRGWIAYGGRACPRVFCELRPRRAHIEIYVLPSPGELGSLGRFLSPVPPTRGWGWFRGRFLLRPAEELGPPVAILEASYALASQGFRRARPLLPPPPRRPRAIRR